MSIANIRKIYGVPAKVRGRVEYTGERGKVLAGKIVSTDRHYLRVRLDDGGRVITLHPTWEIRYLEDSK